MATAVPDNGTIPVVVPYVEMSRSDLRSPNILLNRIICSDDDFEEDDSVDRYELDMNYSSASSKARGMAILLSITRSQAFAAYTIIRSSSNVLRLSLYDRWRH